MLGGAHSEPTTGRVGHSQLTPERDYCAFSLVTVGGFGAGRRDFR